MRNQYNVHYKGTKFGPDFTLEMAIDVARATLADMPKVDFTENLQALRDLGGVLFYKGVPMHYKSILDLAEWPPDGFTG
jgi:hypothetical protein